MDAAAEIDDWLAALLREDGPPRAVPRVGAAVPADLIAERIAYHGVVHLLAERLAAVPSLPKSLAAQLRQEAMLREFWEESHRQALALVLDDLHRQGLAAALMKGTALAYTLYPQPASRVRGDTDLLVPEARLAEVRRTMAAAGGRLRDRVHGVLFQETWQFAAPGGLVHHIDLHWRASDSPLLQALLPSQTMLAEARPAPRLSPAARVVALPLAMVQCVLNAAWHGRFGYRVEGCVAHGPLRLIWAQDLALLAASLSEDEWEALLLTSRDGGIAGAVHDALRQAQGLLGLALPPQVLAALAEAPRDTPAMHYLVSADRRARLRADFRATQGPLAKARFAAAMLTPPVEHLHARFPEARDWPLIALRVRYALASLRRLLRS